MPLTAGSRVGPYEIVSSLGAGGMGEVYRARDARLNREIALKILPDALARDVDRLSRFEREAQAVAALSHPNILAIHDFGTDGPTTYAAMELLEGETLRERLDAGALPVRRAVDVAVQIARGLAAAHDKGLVHRDMKPDNVFVTRDGRVKILDFGLARQVEAPAAASGTVVTRAFTEPGTVLGTVGYMAPEQVRGLAVDARSDIFAFGALLYEMLTGRRAFVRESAAETMTAIAREEPPPLASPLGPVPPALDRLVQRCLEKEPGARFRSCHDLAFALESATLSTSEHAFVAEAALDISTAEDARQSSLVDSDGLCRRGPRGGGAHDVAERTERSLTDPPLRPASGLRACVPPLPAGLRWPWRPMARRSHSSARTPEPRASTYGAATSSRRDPWRTPRARRI